MKKRAIYVYDTREQFVNPVFVVYDMSHIDIVANVIFPSLAEHGYITYERIHPYDENPYKKLTKRR